MRVIVIGAGVIGVTTAYYLNRGGCEVSVYEGQSGVAHGASFGTAGVLAPSGMTPFASPGLGKRLLLQLAQRDPALLLRPSLDPRLWRWLVRALRASQRARYVRHSQAMQRLALYSQAQLTALISAHELQYQRTQGVLRLLRSAEERDAAAVLIEFLKQYDLPYQLLDAAACRRHEPGLSEHALSAGLLEQHAQSGNCALFTRQLRELTSQRGVHYAFSQPVTALQSDAAGIVVHCGPTRVAADAVVVCAAQGSLALLASLGLRLPMYPVKGYSATVTIREPTYAPLATVIDQRSKISFTRLGPRLRVAGISALGDRTPTLRAAPLRTLIEAARTWFAGAADYSQATYWAGVRSMLAEGPALLGPTPVKGVYLNLGHGDAGWGLACGAGKILADLIGQRAPEISLEGLTMDLQS